MNQRRTCPNCGYTVDRRFCPECGQSTRELKRPLIEFVTEFASEVLSLDARLAATFKPLFLKPGLD